MLQSVGEERLLSSSSEKLLQLEEQQSVDIGATCFAEGSCNISRFKMYGHYH